MNTKSLIILTIVTFIGIFLLEFLIHGVGLKGIYESTQSVWRPQEDMEKFMPFAMLSQFLFAVVFSFVFAMGYEAKGPMEGVRYGLIVGAFAGLVSFSFYAYLPIPFTLALVWLVSAIVKSVILGVIATFVYKK